jgi:hypothetical protein
MTRDELEQLCDELAQLAVALGDALTHARDSLPHWRTGVHSALDVLAGRYPAWECRVAELREWEAPEGLASIEDLGERIDELEKLPSRIDALESVVEIALSRCKACSALDELEEERE